MKTILLLFLPALCLAQTEAERNKIAATYDQDAIAAEVQAAKEKSATQKQLIADYKERFGVVDSERHSLQRIEDGLPIFFTIFNDGSSKTIRANRLYPGGLLGLSVTGAGITAGVWDGGKVRNTHVELTGKLTLGDGATDLSAHATHVTGTILAAGISAPRRGVAYGASGLSYDWDDDYSEMLAFGASGYLVSNHSYGYDTASLPSWKFGSYDSSSVEVDQVSNLNPYYQVVLAAGNDRDNGVLEQNGLKGGYDLLSGTNLSKNGITVAAVEEQLNYVDPSSVVMSSFSNFGPPDDGRIKPDIAAKGVGTSSCVSSSNVAYEIFNGTSMAAPAITGLIVLLQKHYNNLNSAFMRASTVRGLICHSAREAGMTDGPDYEYGWGLADGQTAATIISNRNVSTVLEENTLSGGGTFTKQITITAPQKLSVTICWTDPVGATNLTGAVDSRVPRLKNNLDLKVLKDGNTYFPWRLNPEDVTSEATRDADNDVDNIEKVQIDLATPGVYTIQVTHKGSLAGGSQVFSLIASGNNGAGLSANSVDFKDNIVLYPNPVKSTLGFAVPNNGEVTDVSIYDILGKQVKTAAGLVNNSIDLSDLAGGIYMARFTYDGASFTKKFIKE
ncbi:T9SS type A sorting domain-containing protein [Flavobacterium longum]|uniref:S8 family serine peptidase n=1 Tax=Flavobacterium longum TaxID=1299340 RepID=UPI0039EAC792